MRHLYLTSTLLLMLGLCTYAAQADAQTYPLTQDDVVGSIKAVIVKPGDTLAQLARDYDMGYMEMKEANPGIDADHLQPGTVLVIPSRFLLPNAPHNGIVINLAEMRLYYYSNGQVTTHPIGVGREGEETPTTVLRVIEHIPNPVWTVPESIRKLRAEEGVYLPRSVPHGPENPLGNFAMRLSNYTYLIHGTNEPLGGIGRRSSSGCVRMYPEDIENLYHAVPNGANVHVINAPYKAGWAQGKLYLESHIALADVDQGVDDTGQIRSVVELATRTRKAMVDWNKTLAISSETQGLPQVIGQAG